MDGVLIDSGAHHRKAWRALLDELGVEPGQPELWRLSIGRPADAQSPELRLPGLHAQLVEQGAPRLPVVGAAVDEDSVHVEDTGVGHRPSKSYPRLTERRKRCGSPGRVVYLRR